MGEHTKHSTSRVELRERIILAAVELFTTNGIKSITMDEIAASLGIVIGNFVSSKIGKVKST